MKKVVCFLTCAVLLLNITAILSFGEDKERIIVENGIITDESKSILEFKAEKIYRDYGIDVFFVMTDEVGEKGAYNSAVEFYDSRIKSDGFVFCMDRENGSCYIYGGSDVDENERKILAASYTAVEGGTYYDRINGYLDRASETARKLYEGKKNSQSERLMPRFMDNADVIEDKRESSIYTDIDRFSENNHVDVVFVTYAGDEEAKEYAVQYYEENNFGFGEEKNGVILAVNADKNELCVKPFGSMLECLSPERIASLEKKLSKYFEGGDYVGMFIAYLEKLDEVMAVQAPSDGSVTSSPDEFTPLPGNIGEGGELMPRIYDGAKVIDDSTEKEIKLILDEVSGQTGIDFVVLTLYDIPNGMAAGDYAEKYFEHFDFGFGEEKNGVLLMICFEPEYCFLTAFGKAKFYFSSSDLKEYTQSFYGQYKQGKYDEAARIFAHESAQRLMKEKLKLPLTVVAVLAVAATAVLTAIIVSKKKQKNKKQDS